MKKIQRRDFLKAMGLATAALGLTACGGSGAASASSVSSAPASSSSAPSASAQPESAVDKAAPAGAPVTQFQTGELTIGEYTFKAQYIPFDVRRELDGAHHCIHADSYRGNYFFSFYNEDDEEQSAKIFEYAILRMDGMNILFIGIITQDVINQTKSESLVGSFVDTAAAAAEVGKICNAHNSIDIDFTVLLTHIGFEKDRHLARQLDPAWGVDLIIGGHSHTLPEHAVEENGVVIAQAGTGTDQIGRFDIIVDTDNNCIDSYTWRTVPICADTCPRNPAMEQVLHRFTSQVDEKYSHIVGRFRRELTHPERTQETELGNLFADIFTRSLGIDIMLIGSGSIRAEKLGPIVTYGDLIEGFPYDDGVYMFKVTGRQLRQMLRYMLREKAYAGHTEFYQLPSTLRLRYDRAKGDFDYFTYCGKEVGKEIGDDALFTVGLQNYHFKNIESFFNISYDTICKLQKPRSVATSCQDILMEYFREHEMLDAAVDGRMTILPPAAPAG